MNASRPLILEPSPRTNRKPALPMLFWAISWMLRPRGISTSCRSMNTSAPGALATTCCGLLEISHFSGKSILNRSTGMEKRAAARDALLRVVAVDDAVDALVERVAVGRERPASRLQLLNGRLNLAHARERIRVGGQPVRERPVDRRPLRRAVRASKETPGPPPDPIRAATRIAHPADRTAARRRARI